MSPGEICRCPGLILSSFITIQPHLFEPLLTIEARTVYLNASLTTPPPLLFSKPSRINPKILGMDNKALCGLVPLVSNTTLPLSPTRNLYCNNARVLEIHVHHDPYQATVLYLHAFALFFIRNLLFTLLT